MGVYQGNSYKKAVAAVMCIISPSWRTVLVMNTFFAERGKTPYWKFPGGGIESDDCGLIDAAIREAAEETGITKLLPEEVDIVSKEERVNGIYRANFLVARVSEEKLDTRRRVTEEITNRGKSRMMLTTICEWKMLLKMENFLPQHRELVRRAERFLSRVA